MRKIKRVLFVFVMMFVGVIGVCAATQNVMTKSVNLSSGGAAAWTNLSASYANAKAMTEPTSITSGTKKTKIIGYLQSNGTLTNKQSAITPISTTLCNIVNVGSIGKGTWYIINQAFDGSTNYAGWKGTLSINSYN